MNRWVLEAAGSLAERAVSVRRDVCFGLNHLGIALCVITPKTLGRSKCTAPECQGFRGGVLLRL